MGPNTPLINAPCWTFGLSNVTVTNTVASGVIRNYKEAEEQGDSHCI